MVPPARGSQPDIDERTPPGGTSLRVVPLGDSPEVVWRKSVLRRLDHIEENQGRTLGALSRIEGRIARAGTALIVFALVAILPHLGPPAGWHTWAMAHPKETGAALALALVLNSVMPRGERPEGGLSLAWWLVREYIALLDRKGWFGKWKVGLADYDRQPPTSDDTSRKA